MRSPWQGRVVFENAQQGGFTGGAHFYDEALSKTVAPQELREDESRWWYVGKESDADSVSIGHNGWSEWPHDVAQALQWITHSLLRHRLAVIEWGIVEDDEPRPKFLMLPAWSCKVVGRAIYQQQEEGGEWILVERGVPISLPSALQATLDKEIRAILELEAHHIQAMWMTGPAILGETKVNVMGVMHEVDTRSWEATRESGYPPAASMLGLSPAYRALRRARFEFFCQRIRQSVISQLDAFLRTAFHAAGRRLMIGYHEGWNEQDEERLAALALGSDEDRQTLEQIFAPQRVARRERIKKAIEGQAAPRE